jgi:hypothetical protein
VAHFLIAVSSALAADAISAAVGPEAFAPAARRAEIGAVRYSNPYAAVGSKSIMAASHHDAKQWAASLGVHVSDARLAANPGLARLLDELAAMHDPSTGLSRATAARLASAQAAEHEARSAALGAEWLLERIRACAERRLRELLRERQRRVGQEQPSPLERAWQRIRAALIAGTAASSADAASLGLDAEHILAAQPAMSEIGSGGAPAEKETRACVADIEAECAKWRESAAPSVAAGRAALTHALAHTQ